MTRLITTWVFVTAFLFANIAAAGLPPTSTKSQLDTSKSTTFDFQAPFNQFTKPSGTTALIETGNKNLLKDPGFESSDPTAVWVIALAGTVSRTSTAADVGSGSYALSYDAAATNGTVTSAAVAVPNGFIGKTLEASCDIKNTSAGLYKIQAYDGTNVLAEQLITTDSTYFVRNTLRFPSPTSGSISIRFLAGTAGEPVFYVDDCYLGIDRGQGSTQLISEWTSYTPTTAGLGTVTSVNFKWRRVGDSMEIQGRLAAGTATAVAATISLPSPYVASSTKLSTGGEIVGSIVIQSTITAVDWYIIGTGGSSNLNIGIKTSTTTGGFTYSNGNAIVNAATDTIGIQVTIPIVGWTAQTTASIDAISKRGSAYFSTGSAATTTSGSAVAFNDAAFASPTLEGQALAPTTANDIGIRMTGAPAGVYEVNLVGWLYAYRASGETGTNCVYDLYDGTTSRSSTVAGAPNVAGVSTLDGISALSGTFTLSSAGTINVVLRGQRTSGTGACYAGGPVSISIKNVSQNSPALVIANSVSTSATNGLRTESFSFTCSGSSSIGVQLGGTSWVSSVGNIAAGVCAVGISAGTFSGSPQCQATWTGGGSNAVFYTYAETSSGFNVGAVTDTGIAASSFTGKAMCVGPR